MPAKLSGGKIAVESLVFAIAPVVSAQMLQLTIPRLDRRSLASTRRSA
jgi:hypothetical protein